MGSPFFAAAVWVSAAIFVLPTAQVAASPANKQQAIVFKVGPNKLVGNDELFCVISGQWRNGEPFRYTTWDRCRDLTIREIGREEAAALAARGAGQGSAVVIPEGEQILEVTNGVSKAIVFRGPDGATVDELVGD